MRVLVTLCAVVVVGLVGHYTFTSVHAQANRPEILAAVDVANPNANAPLASGSLVSLYGRNLAGSQAVVTTTPLPRLVSAVQVLVSGVPAPLLFVSEGQINFQLHFEISGPTATIVVINNGVPSAPFQINLAQVSPAIFTLSGSGSGQAAALNQDGTLATADNPFLPNQIVTLFANGLGPVDPPVPSGEAAPSTAPLARIVNEIQVLFDGVPGEVIYAGLAPNLVGAYQVNARAPGSLVRRSPEVAIQMLGAISNLVTIGPPDSAPNPGPTPNPNPGGIDLGVHWPDLEDYAQLSSLDLDFAITTLAPDDTDRWTEVFDAADSAGIRLIVGLFPEPYQFVNGRWVISTEGVAFLRFAAARAKTMKALFVFSEPYWIDPATRETNICGAVAADDLRALRVEIQRVWPGAEIFHDIGAPLDWTPGRELATNNPCIGNKFANQRGVADLVGVSQHRHLAGTPFDIEANLASIGEQAAYVRDQMGAEVLIGLQTFSCGDCNVPPHRLPSPAELFAWQCAIRSLAPQSISFYPWRLDEFDQVLSGRPELWPMLLPTGCPAL